MPSGRRIEWAPQATDDLTAIWSYHAETASRDVANKMVRDIGDAVARLNRLKVPGRPRQDISAFGSKLTNASLPLIV